jgi:fructoselysine-6-P-deglycase FrlB-like protein
MSTFRESIELARKSEYFSGARLPEELGAFLSAESDACRELGRRLKGATHVYLVGSGGSWATLQTAKYALDGYLAAPIEAMHSYDFIWRRPARLQPGALVILASYSGETEDTVAALRFARQAGATTVGIVKGGDSAIRRESDHAIEYGSAAIFEAPIAALLLLAAGMSEGTPAAAAAEELAAAVAAVPDAVRESLQGADAWAEEHARAFLSSRHLYVLGAGPLSPLAYKVALTVVMENIRIGGTWIDASEWRHGPAEALERSQADALMLVGTDPSRPMCQRSLAFLREHGARTLVIDAADYAGVHPLLTPLVLNSLTQWLTVWSAVLRGIADLDHRVFMGRQVLAEGGHRWP